MTANTDVAGIGPAHRESFEFARLLINRRDRVGTGSWGRNVLSWLRPTAPHRVVLRYEELIREPGAAAGRVMAAVAPDLRSLAPVCPGTTGSVP
jgi:hypothetical protein